MNTRHVKRKLSLSDVEEVADTMAKKIRDNIVTDYIISEKIKAFPEGSEITNSMLDKFKKDYREKAENHQIQSTVSNVPILYLATSREHMKNINFVYRYTIEDSHEDVPVPSDQKYTGTCWMFAGLNILRRYYMQKYQLNNDFELSYSYLFFWNKLETANLFLELIIANRTKNPESLNMVSKIGTFNPAQDGGYWSFFVNLIKKYGIVPKSVFTPCANTKDSSLMNEILNDKIIEFTMEIFKNSKKSVKQLQKLKNKTMLPVIYELLSHFMGQPLNPKDTFKWIYSKKHSQKRKEMDGLTAHSFYGLISDHANIEHKITLVNDPRDNHPYYQNYLSDSANITGMSKRYIWNVPIEVMKSACLKSIKHGVPVWFGCDVSKNMILEHGILDDTAHNYASVLGITIDINKADRLRYRTGNGTHAMLMVGVDTEFIEVEDKDKNKQYEKPTKWRIENSWGKSINKMDPGYLQMSDTWFNEHVYEAVVDLHFLDDETRQKINEIELSHANPIKLSVIDLMTIKTN